MKERLNILYQNGQNGLTPAVSASGLLNAVARKWITIEDAVEIIGTDKSAEVIRAAKVAEISAACNAVIVSGIDLELADGPVHFNLSIEDQSNIANLFRVVELGGTEFPYQADGGVCRIYNAQEIAQIYIAAQTAITTQTTYHNALKAYVQGLDDVEQIAAVQYGMTLPDPYASEVAEKLSVAQTQMNAIVARLGGNA
ncbi:hypothetical protein AALB19_00955 [Oscillospiraceae bacterium 50-58]|jgi:hypothetical protein|nr:hypothetical protein [Oscillospiraceae bacterium]